MLRIVWIALVIVVVFPLSSAGHSLSPVTLEACEEILKNGSLPKSVSMILTRREMTAFFETSVQQFEEKFNANDLIEIGSRVASGELLSPHGLTRLMANRIPLRQLRFAFGLFSHSHSYPPVINELTKILGDIQDAHRNAKPEMLKMKAALLLRLLDPDFQVRLQNEIRGFRPCSTASFLAYIRSQINYLDDELRNGRMTANQFHEMRKVVARLVAFYSLVQAAAPADDIEQGLQFLRALNWRMGWVHDELVAESLELTRDYHRDRVQLASSLREVLESLVSQFANL